MLLTQSKALAFYELPQKMLLLVTMASLALRQEAERPSRPEITQSSLVAYGLGLLGEQFCVLEVCLERECLLFAMSGEERADLKGISLRSDLFGWNFPKRGIYLMLLARKMLMALLLLRNNGERKKKKTF